MIRYKHLITKSVQADLDKISNDKSKNIFMRIVAILDRFGAEAVSRLGAIYTFRIKGIDGKELIFTIDLQHGDGAIYFGEAGAQFYDVNGPVPAGKTGEAGSLEPIVTMTMSERDFHAMLDRQLDAVRAIVFGKLKIGGSVGEANRFNAEFLAPYFGDNSEFAKIERGEAVLLLI